MQMGTTGEAPTRGSLAALAAAARRRRVAQLGDAADKLDREVLEAMRAEPGWAELAAADAALLAAAGYPGDPLDVALGFDQVPWTTVAAGER